jgi:uncharacterized membrane protein
MVPSSNQISVNIFNADFMLFLIGTFCDFLLGSLIMSLFLALFFKNEICVVIELVVLKRILTAG